MRRLAACALLACAGAGAGGAFAADDAALRVIEACRARLDARTDIGVERIAKRCPDLLPAISAAPWHGLVPATLRERREELSRESLGALVALVRASQASAPAGVALPVEKLAPVLAELGAQGKEGVTRWERFKRWLKDLRGRRAADDEGLLSKWSRDFTTSEGVARLISYVAYAVLAALTLLVIVAELRAAGLFGARRRAPVREAATAPWRRRLTLADLPSVPLVDRPGVLLRLLGEALTRAQRLPAADGLSAPAIARRARIDDTTDRADLEQVAATAEHIRFAGRVPPDAELEATVERATALLTRIAPEAPR